MIARRSLLTVVMPLTTAVMACAALRALSGTGAPHVDRVVPDSVLLVPGAAVEVAIQGSGFAEGKPGRNTIRFGDATITDVAADDAGREIRFMIPQTMPARGDAAPAPLEGGRYALRVETNAGVSNAVTVRIDR